MLLTLHIALQLASAQMEVEITSHTPDQRVPISKLTLEGRSLDTTNADCEVQISINNMETYLRTIPTGPGGPGDFSNWQFTSNVLHEGINSVTAKYVCWDNPNLDTYYTINLEVNDFTYWFWTSSGWILRTHLPLFHTSLQVQDHHPWGATAGATAAYVEVCDNGMDDDEDQLVDQNDPECQPAPEEEAQPAPEEEAQPAPEEEAQPAPEEEAQPAPEEEAEPAPEEEAEPAPEEEQTSDEQDGEDGENGTAKLSFGSHISKM